jgi:hypothetical protein
MPMTLLTRNFIPVIADGSYAVASEQVEVKSKKKSKAVPLHAMEALGGRGDIAPTHSRPRH